MLISCGGALFTARLALRYRGYVPETELMPDPDRPMLIARMRWDERVPPRSTNASSTIRSCAAARTGAVSRPGNFPRSCCLRWHRMWPGTGPSCGL